MEELYKQEIQELTELLRTDENWSDLREILEVNGFDLNQILLVSFMEDEEENEYGVIVTKDLDICEYSKSTKECDNNAETFKMNYLTGNQFDEYPQISVAINMIKNKDVLYF